LFQTTHKQLNSSNSEDQQEENEHNDGLLHHGQRV
jgi:hypothetical protein